MHFILDYIKGIAIGAGAILPGISSGVLCVIFGIYENLINSLLGFFKNWKSNLLFLLPIILGGLTGVILFSNLLQLLFDYYPVYTKFTFIGLILGGIPCIFKHVHSKNHFRLHYALYLLGSLFLAILLLLLEKNIGIYEPNYCRNTFSFSFFVMAGFLMSAGVVIPGISSTVILMLLGIYDIYLGAISIVNMSILFPMAIGLLIGGLLFLILIKKLLEHYPCQTYYAIIGFVLGSIPVLYPGFSFDMSSLISLTLLIIGFIVGLNLEKI